MRRANYPNPIFDAYVEAGGEAGFPVTQDFNGAQFEGFGRYDMNIWGGRRQSASETYLKPVLGRGNLTVMVGALTTRVTIEKARAVGVEYLDGSERKVVTAEREVILCGGAINSPQILLHSGVRAMEMTSARWMFRSRPPFQGSAETCRIT